MRSILFALLCFCVITASVNAAENSDANGAEKSKPCFQCNGTGETKCTQPTCKNGVKDCPGPCLKLSVGTWEKRNVPGHTDPNERWQRIRVGPKQSVEISSGHIGECLVRGADGKFVPVKCKVCGGAATVTCPQCKGKGTVTCFVCEGKKIVSASWSAFDYPKMKNRPKKFVLKDGRTLIGRDIMISGDTVTIRTETNDVRVTQSEIVSQEAQKTVP